MFFMRCSESGRISIDSTRRPPTAADISCTLGAPTAKKKTSILPDLKSSDARITFTVGTFFTSFIDTPPAASSAFRCVMTLVCCTQPEGMFLPLRSAMVWIGESLRTQNAIWKPNRLIARRMLGFGLPFQTFSPFIASAGSPTSSSRKSACFELTASMMPVSPPWPMTRTCSLLLSCTTLAITEACALSSVPGCSVAKPTVCWASAAPQNAAAPRAVSVLKIMPSPPPRVARVYLMMASHRPMKLPKDRIPYSAIVDRPPLKLPNDGRVAVWTIVNVEEWSIERNMPRTVLPPPYGQPLQPDLPNWAWHEYGMRVGFWRLVEVLEKHKVKATLAINGSVIKSYPRVAKAGLDAGWEFMGHGWIQRPMHHVEDQKKAIQDTVAAIRQL